MNASRIADKPGYDRRPANVFLWDCNMPDTIIPASPIGAHAKRGPFGAVNDAGPAVTLAEEPLGALFQIAGWGSSFNQAAVPALSSLGLAMPDDYRTVASGAEVEAFRIAPDRLWLRAADATVFQAAEAQLDREQAAMLDLSSARTAMTVTGHGLEDLLARVCSVDPRETAFPPGTFVQTGLHGIGCLIHRRTTGSVAILAPTTWALAVWEMLVTCAEPLGGEIA